jgi:hypothetical protein
MNKPPLIRSISTEEAKAKKTNHVSSTYGVKYNFLVDEMFAW